jgi:hypothetical protein
MSAAPTTRASDAQQRGALSGRHCAIVVRLRRNAIRHCPARHALDRLR